MDKKIIAILRKLFLLTWPYVWQGYFVWNSSNNMCKFWPKFNNLQNALTRKIMRLGFPLLRYSVLFTLESLSLLYLLFISRFICSRRWCIDKIGVFHANQHLCVLIHIWTKDEVGAPLNRFKPSSIIFILAGPRRCLFCGSFVLFLFCFVMLSCKSVCWCLVVTCWERADLLVLNCDVLLWRCHFPTGILGQVWYLIVLIPGLCPLSYFGNLPLVIDTSTANSMPDS